MRTALIALGLVAAGVLAVAAAILVWRRVEATPVGSGLDQICVETMERRPPDLSWVAPGREAKIRGRKIPTVTPGELPVHIGELVRVTGVLHAEFEWVALYPSRASMDKLWTHAPWVSLDPLWPDDPYWRTKKPMISDRCVVIEGTYAFGAAGHVDGFTGTIGDVLRLDVWSTPQRPFVTAPPPPPPVPAETDAACSEKPSAPKPLPDPNAGHDMLAGFDILYETGEFRMGYCLADVRLNDKGTVDTVRVVRPENVDTRVESLIVRSMKSRRYEPATACGRAVPFTLSIGLFHCPSRSELPSKPDR